VDQFYLGFSDELDKLGRSKRWAPKAFKWARGNVLLPFASTAITAIIADQAISAAGALQKALLRRKKKKRRSKKRG
jgi:hypothetical protein